MAKSDAVAPSKPELDVLQPTPPPSTLLSSGGGMMRVPQVPVTGSQMPSAHARAAMSGLHAVPGMPTPVGVFGWQIALAAPARLLHHWPCGQSASAEQLMPHAPLVSLQNGPLCVPVLHSLSAPHLPQVPFALQ